MPTQKQLIHGQSGAQQLTLTRFLGVQNLQGMHHGTCKNIGVFFAPEIEPVNLSRIPPLVEGLSRLVVLQPLGNGTVDHHLQERQKSQRKLQ